MVDVGYEELTDEQKESLRIVGEYIVVFIKSVWTILNEAFQLFVEYINKFNNVLEVALEEIEKHE